MGAAIGENEDSVSSYSHRSTEKREYNMHYFVEEYNILHSLDSEVYKVDFRCCL